MKHNHKKEIKYIGFYDLPDGAFERVAALPAVNKMDYICDALNRAGFNVHIVSPSWLGDGTKNKGYIRQKTIELSPYKKITFCPSFGTKSKLVRNIKIIFTLVWLFLWLVKNSKKDEKILMYHTPWLSVPVRLSKKIKKFKLILEVEEIYSDVTLIHPYFRVLEYDLIKVADYYIFSTELINEKINSSQKPYLILYGTYKIIEKLDVPPDDGKIHLLYAGVIDSHKAGAFNAIEASRFLPDQYIMHIIGFGEIVKLNKRINELNQTNRCKIIFDGVKKGEDYIRYCQRCHIGISSQRMSGKYLETSFPSKILSYLGLGLRVVSCEIECVKRSLLNDLIINYKDDNPESIARAIMSVDMNSEFDSTGLLRELDSEFVDNIKSLISNNTLNI